MDRGVATIAIALVVAAAACADDAVLEECVDVSADCAPLYTPEFDEIFNRTLKPKCALEGGSCHSIEGAKADLVFEDADDAYDQLLGNLGNRVRVTPGDITCSILTRRLATSKTSLLMPPGNVLSPAEQCVIIQWINNGAPR